MKKSVQHILVFMLSLVILYLGAGVAFVHICSSYCQKQPHASCHFSEDDFLSEDGIFRSSAESYSRSGKGCCQSHPISGAVKVEKHCSHIQTKSACACLDITFQIDFFYQLSQQALAVVAQMPADLPLQFAMPQQPVNDLLDSLLLASNAPPGEDGRTLLAFHSVLII